MIVKGLDLARSHQTPCMPGNYHLNKQTQHLNPRKRGTLELAKHPLKMQDTQKSLSRYLAMKLPRNLIGCYLSNHKTPPIRSQHLERHKLKEKRSDESSPLTGKGKKKEEKRVPTKGPGAVIGKGYSLFGWFEGEKEGRGLDDWNIMEVERFKSCWPRGEQGVVIHVVRLVEDVDWITISC